MGRPQEVVTSGLAEKAKEALSRQAGGKVSVRLQAIASCGSHPVKTVAEVLGVSRRAVWQWARRFAADGVSGLADRPRGHRRGRVTADQQAQMGRWLEQGRTAEGHAVHWTLEKLRAAIRDSFGVKLSVNAVWKRVRQLGFRQKVPRPRHRRADEQAQDAFKKKSLTSPTST